MKTAQAEASSLCCSSSFLGLKNSENMCAPSGESLALLVMKSVVPIGAGKSNFPILDAAGSNPVGFFEGF